MGYRKLPPLKIPDKPEILGYLAGLIDGEGNITIATAFSNKNSKNPSHSIKVTITNSSRTLIDWLLITVEGGNISKKIHRDHPNWKDSWNWQVYGSNAEQFLRATLPYLVIKQAQARIALQLRELGRGKWKGRGLDKEVVQERESLKQQIHVLNARGK